MAQPETADASIYDRLMQANLLRVFGERDGQRRLAGIAELYAAEAVFYEPHSAAIGHAAINAAVETLLSRLPPDSAFAALGPALGHHGVGRLRWQSGRPNAATVVTGTDVAMISDGLIIALYVFVDPVMSAVVPGW